MIAITHDDLVIGRGDGIIGPAIPKNLLPVPDERLRLVAGAVIDAGDVTDWFVDGDGQKHVAPAPGRQALTCAIDAPLELVGGVWQIADALAQLKSRLKTGIDAEAERQRLRWITPGAGQAMTYQAKAEEARRLVVDHDPQPGSYSLLAAEVGITAPSLAGVGAVVLAAYQQWLSIGGAIEAVRLAAKAAIENAGDEAAALAVQATWPSA